LRGRARNVQARSMPVGIFVYATAAMVRGVTT
jgi:hypothetical protein